MNTNLLRWALVIGCVLDIASCAGSVEFTPLNPAPHPIAAKDPAQVEVFEAGPPARSHVDVGSFEIMADGGPKVADFRAAAANRGCDGVVLKHDHDADRGVCIVYSDSPR